jgi:hypothetical protein
MSVAERSISANKSSGGCADVNLIFLWDTSCSRELEEQFTLSSIQSVCGLYISSSAANCFDEQEANRCDGEKKKRKGSCQDVCCPHTTPYLFLKKP